MIDTYIQNLWLFYRDKNWLMVARVWMEGETENDYLMDMDAFLGGVVKIFWN